jgi:hypothetical protein
MWFSDKYGKVQQFAESNQGVFRFNNKLKGAFVITTLRKDFRDSGAMPQRPSSSINFFMRNCQDFRLPGLGH